MRAREYLLQIQRSTGTPGLSAAVLSGDELVFSEGVGFADLDNLVPATALTVYNIGSVSKAIAAVAVLQLVDRGRVALDDTIQTYIPKFPEKRWPVTSRRVPSIWRFTN